MKNKVTASQLLNVGVTVISVIGMILTAKAQEAERKELKAEIKAELQQEERTC
jgi:thiamine monophosphate synthase